MAVIRNRFVGFAFLFVSGSTATEGFNDLRIQSNSLSVVCNRLIGLVFRQIRISPTAIGHGILGIEADGFGGLCNRGINFSSINKGCVVSPGTWLALAGRWSLETELLGLGKVGFRFGLVAFLLECPAPLKIRKGRVRVQPDGLSEVGNVLVVVAHFVVSVAPIIVASGIVRVQPDGLGVIANRLFKVALPLVGRGHDNEIPGPIAGCIETSDLGPVQAALFHFILFSILDDIP